MATEMTVRFASSEASHRATGCVLLQSELATIKGLLGGFYFTSERSPIELLKAFEEEGFEMVDFDNIEFRNV